MVKLPAASDVLLQYFGEASMLKGCRIVLAFVLASSMTARAQTDIAASPNAGQSAPDQLKYAMGPWPLDQDYLNSIGFLNQNYLTATGQTVPRPSVLPIQQQRPKRKIKNIDDQWERSICSNC
jgi:hypothetical protein